MQIKASTNSARGSAEIDISKQWIDWHARITEDDELMDLWDKGLATDQMTYGEWRKYGWLMAQFFFLVEGIYRQRERGLISEESWAPFRDLAVNMSLNPNLRKWWEEEWTNISPEFLNHINDFRKTAEWEGSSLSGLYQRTIGGDT